MVCTFGTVTADGLPFGEARPLPGSHTTRQVSLQPDILVGMGTAIILTFGSKLECHEERL
jgi:hypothetical protein